MRRVGVVEGRMVPLDRRDVDTDQIMPKQFLTRVERDGYGEFVFSDWRADPDFVLNDPRRAGATVLVAGANFGAGSSREHAAWGLQQYGFEAVVAPSFADIFRTNCTKNGLLTVTLPPEHCRYLLDLAGRDPGTVVRVDLPAQRVTCDGLDVAFEFDPHRKRMLTGGLDEIGLAMEQAPRIAEYEAHRPPWYPTTTPHRCAPSG